MLKSIKGRTYKEETKDANIILQQHKGARGGRRDIIIETKGLRILIEAKIDDSIPSYDQLRKYAVTHGN